VAAGLRCGPAHRSSPIGMIGTDEINQWEEEVPKVVPPKVTIKLRGHDRGDRYAGREHERIVRARSPTR